MRLPHAHGIPMVKGRLRSVPEDFVVDEVLGFVPEGWGDHLWLGVRKRGENTAWVARQLSRLAGCPERDVGYSGLKDRHAVTTQWFSLPAPRKPVNWAALRASTAADICVITRHTRKLRRGTHRANRFLLTVRELEGDLSSLPQRLARIAREGVPNWFAEQRFGHQGSNLDAVREWFGGGKSPHRSKQGILLSSARGELFNAVLATRIERGDWLQALPGEPLMLDGRRSFFIAEADDPALPARIASAEVHTSGPLWGKGGTQAIDECAAFERSVIAHQSLLADGLLREGLEAARRPLRVIPRQMHWRLDTTARTLTVGFILPSGSYATAVMREIVDTPEALDQP